MKIKSRQSSRGVALIMVMIAVAVFTALAAALAFSMKVETKLARTADDEQQLLWLGRSGVEYARWILSQHPVSERYDSLNQIWAGGPGSAGETNSALTGISMTDYPVGDGTISIKIIDLERKVNVNTANSVELQQVLTVMGVNADDISVVSDSILDWRDTDDAPHVAGAESDYYQGLNPPYYAKNAPFDNLAELLLVKGVTPEMYWGISATNHTPGTFQKPKLGFGTAPGETPDYPFGLVDIFTPFSSGQINVNTADANVLQTIPGMDATTAESIIKYRSGPDGAEATEDDTPFQSVGQLNAAGISPAVVQQLGRYCTVNSSTFEVHVTAKAGDTTREYTAILYRNGTDIQVVSFWWK
ncbi:MAG TPA: general secretion pathway protein GspK [Verrucomicrobiae bacterium]|nr:general secretion pathway protein GspK [Verrucomicrobiae bacterium]